MAKQHVLTSPFGPATVRVQPRFAEIEADALSTDWTLGWWHAHEAGDDAVFQRSFWRAELSTQKRPSVGRSELDAFIRPWGFMNDLAAEVNNMSAGERARVQAYAQGFNEGRRRRRGEDAWTPEDCHLLARTMGFLEWWETRAPQVEFFQSSWKGGLAWDRLADLWPGLGAEPDRREGRLPPFQAAFSAEARDVLDAMRRFRSSPAWVVPASRSASGRPLLAACYVSDVTDPGSPFLPVRIDTPTGRLRGLSRPGHPGFLSGKTSTLAWHITPAVDDNVDLRHVDGKTVTGLWAGSGHTGTLESLLCLESQQTVAQARERMTIGSACLDFAVVDLREGARWPQGPRWLRPKPVDAWVPAPWQSEVPTGYRSPINPLELPNKSTVAMLQTMLSSTRSDLPERALATLRSLLPDTEEGHLLRRWTGSPENTREAQLFERLYGAVIDAFWESSPVVPPADSSLSQAMAPTVDRLIEAPHSAWFASQEKNRRLSEAVRRAFSPGATPGPPVLRRRAPYAQWTELLGGRPHVFAATVAIVVDPAEPTWKVRLTDDETDPSFAAW